MKYTCDALLPTAERYASLKFRRFSRWFRPSKLDWFDALELVAFVESIGGVKFAAYVFHWGQAGVGAYGALKRHMVAKYSADVEAAISENISAQSVDVGLAVLRAMQDGGWQSHGLPKVVRMALREIHARGLSYSKIAARVGLTHHQVRWAVENRAQMHKRRQASAIGALSVGLYGN